MLFVFSLSDKNERQQLKVSFSSKNVPTTSCVFFICFLYEKKAFLLSFLSQACYSLVEACFSLIKRPVVCTRLSSLLSTKPTPSLGHQSANDGGTNCTHYSSHDHRYAVFPLFQDPYFLSTPFSFIPQQSK